MSFRASGLGRQAELIAKGAGEGFMRCVAGVDGDSEDVGSAGGERARRFGQPAFAHITHDGVPRSHGEGACQMIAGDAGTTGYVLEGDIALEAALDEPERLFDRIPSQRSHRHIRYSGVSMGPPLRPT